MKKTDIGRWILSLILVICMWSGQKWALYLIVTLSLLANEATSFVLSQKGIIE